MPIQVVCPDCEHAFAVRDEFAGKKGKCPKCGGIFRAEPAEETISISLAGKSAARPSSIARRAAGGSGLVSNGHGNGAANGSTDDLGLGDFGGAAAPVAAASASGGSKSPPKGGAAKKPRRAGPPPMPMAGWVTIGVLGIAAAVGATLLYTKGSDSAKEALEKTVSAIDDGSKAEDVRKKMLAQVKSLEDEVATLKKQLADAEAGKSAKKAGEKNLANAFEETLIPGVVKVKAYSAGGELLNTATGFIADDKFHIVTTYKVTEGAAKIGVVLSTRTEYETEGMVAANPGTNLAVLKPKGDMPGAKALKLAEGATTLRGQTIYSVGNPGRQEFTVARGIITRVIPSSRLAEENQNFYEVDFKPDAASYTYIEHDARIFPGDYGGPLVNENLEVIGVNLVLATMVMNDRVTVVPTLGGACTIDNATKLVATAKDAILPYPPAPKKKSTKADDKKSEKKDEKKDDEKKEDEKSEEEPKEEEPKEEESKEDEKSEDKDAEENEEGGDSSSAAGQIDALVEECDKFDFVATDEGEYTKLAELAKGVAAAKEADPDGDDDDKKAAAAAKKVEEKLDALDWDDSDAIGKANGFAEKQTPKAGEGVFVVGAVKGGSEFDGKFTALVALEGTDLCALVPVEDKNSVSPGSKKVVVGTYDQKLTAMVTVDGKQVKAIWVTPALVVDAS